MKISYAAAASLAMSVAASGLPALAAQSGDLMALDNFISANLNLSAGAPVAGQPQVLPGDDQVALGRQGVRYDSEGYLIGPDGKRIKQQIRVQWQIGVFR